MLNTLVLQAESQNLEAETAADFIQSLININKSIQYKYFAEWSVEEITIDDPPDLILNQKLMLKSAADIFKLLHIYLKKHKNISENTQAILLKKLQNKHLSHHEKELLFKKIRYIEFHEVE